MNRRDLHGAMVAAEASIAKRPRLRLGPQGLEEVPARVVVVPRTGKPRKNSKQGRRGHTR